MARDTEYVLSLLEEYGMVTPEQVAKAREEAETTGGLTDAVDILKKNGVIQEQELLAMLAQQYGMELVDISSFDIPQGVIDALGPDVVQHYRVVPVAKHDNILTVAMSDPSDMETLDTIRYILGGDVDAVVAPQSQIEKQILKHYADESEQVKHYVDDNAIGDADMIIENGENTSALGDAEADDDENAPIIRLVTMLIIDAYKMKASDIHLEPMEKRYRVRYRVDGALREVDGPPKFMQANFTSRVKIMARLDITEKRIPQDGRIQVTVGDKDIDLRVSSIPTTHGESIVMRILDKASIQLDIPKLGFYADDLEMVNRIINYPDGIFLVTGPTGSGKTTSLYAFLNTINTTSRKLITVEDPVEYQLAGINQVQVDRHVDMTFSAALRSMLRQAPNIIMVGETRDGETAGISVRAAITGHLVLSTLHTNDAVSSIVRLADMGIDHYLIANSLVGLVAQRLMRKVCPHCGREVAVTPQEQALLGKDITTIKRGTGCTHCNGTGYRGRIAVHEIVTIDRNIRRMISRGAETEEIVTYAREQQGMRSLKEKGLELVKQGVTTPEELLRIAYYA